MSMRCKELGCCVAYIHGCEHFVGGIASILALLGKIVFQGGCRNFLRIFFPHNLQEGTFMYGISYGLAMKLFAGGYL